MFWNNLLCSFDNIALEDDINIHVDLLPIPNYQRQGMDKGKGRKRTIESLSTGGEDASCSSEAQISLSIAIKDEDGVSKTKPADTSYMSNLNVSLPGSSFEFVSSDVDSSNVPLDFFSSTLGLSLVNEVPSTSSTIDSGSELWRDLLLSGTSIKAEYESATEKVSPIPEDCLQKLTSQDEDGDMMLHILIAAEENNRALQTIESMKRCNASKMHYNLQNRRKQTCLHIAAAVGALLPARQLICFGASLSAVDEKGNTPIHVACLRNQPEFVQMALTVGSERSKEELQGALLCRNYEGKAPLHLVIAMRNIDVLKAMLDHMDTIDMEESLSGKTALIIAIELQDERQVSLLLSKHPDVNQASFNGWTPLHYACMISNNSVVKELLALNANPNVRTHEKESAKEIASDPKIINLLQSKIRKVQRSTKDASKTSKIKQIQSK